MGKGGLTKEDVGPEGVLLMDTIGNLRRMGWAVWSMEQARKGESSRQTPGIADVLAHYGSTFLALELKANYNTPTDAQMDFLECWQASGNPAAVVWSFTDILWVLHQVTPGRAPAGGGPDVEDLSLPRFRRFNVRLHPEWKELLDG